MKVVVYFRQNGGTTSSIPSSTHWTEDEKKVPVPSFSVFGSDEEDGLPHEILAQVVAANDWLEEHGGMVIEAFTEIEDGSGRRPAYGAARKAAGQNQAVLLVAAGGEIAGQIFGPSTQSELAVMVLTDRKSEISSFGAMSETTGAAAEGWPALIKLPTSPFPIALYFGKKQVRGKVPVYLANATESDFTGVTVKSAGSAFFDESLISTTASNRRLGFVPKGHARLVEAYDIYLDGDFLIEYRLLITLADGSVLDRRAWIKDIPPNRWLRVEVPISQNRNTAATCGCQ